MMHLLILPILLMQLIFDRSFTSDAQLIALDEPGNFYLANGRTIEKRDNKGNLLFKNSSLDFGNITYIDLTNGMKPLLFYKEQGKMIVLDNTLSQQGGVIDLFLQGFGQIEAVAASRGDAYWLWDASSTTLHRVDKQFSILNSSGNIAPLIGKEVHPVMIKESGNNLYLSDPAIGIMVFDIYANYKYTIKVNFDGNFTTTRNGSTLVYRERAELVFLGENKIDEMRLTLPEECKGFPALHGNMLHCLTGTEVKIFKMSEH